MCRKNRWIDAFLNGISAKVNILSRSLNSVPSIPLITPYNCYTKGKKEFLSGTPFPSYAISVTVHSKWNKFALQFSKRVVFIQDQFFLINVWKRNIYKLLPVFQVCYILFLQNQSPFLQCTNRHRAGVKSQRIINSLLI